MIGRILITVGILFMILGSLLTLIETKFSKKLHWIGISDTIGASLVFIGMGVNGFGTLKATLAFLFIILWGPSLTHTLARAFLSRLEK